MPQLTNPWPLQGLDRPPRRTFFQYQIIIQYKKHGNNIESEQTDRSIIRGIHYNAGLRRHADPRSDRHTAQLPDQSSRCRFCFRQLRNNEYRSAIIKNKVISDSKSLLFRYRSAILFDAMFNWSIVWVRLYARRKSFLKLGRYIEEHSIEDRWGQSRS